MKSRQFEVLTLLIFMAVVGWMSLGSLFAVLLLLPWFTRVSTWW